MGALTYMVSVNPHNYLEENEVYKTGSLPRAKENTQQSWETPKPTPFYYTDPTVFIPSYLANCPSRKMLRVRLGRHLEICPCQVRAEKA